MGKITEPLLDVLGIEHVVLGKELSEQEVDAGFDRATQKLREGKQFAFVLKRDFLVNEQKVSIRIIIPQFGKMQLRKL